MNKRRDFIKTVTLITAGVAIRGTALGFNTDGLEKISLVFDPKDTVANAQSAQWALEQLKEALKTHGVKSAVYAKLKDAPVNDLCVLVSGSRNKAALDLLKKRSLTIPETPEALGLVRGEMDGRSVLLACGHDSRGLVYALLELADRINYGIKPAEALKITKPIIEKPALKVRSIYRAFTSEIEDKSWYNNREFWKSYLTELANQRINRFSLSLGMGYNSPAGCVDSYLFFAYPFLVNVPGYNVRAVGLPDEERDRNLEMLKFISSETAARGIEFCLALWSNGCNFPKNVNYPVTGLEAKDHAFYCRDAVAIILKTCPAISGITYRVHSESGIPDGTKDFWDILFQANQKAGRTVWIDMHGKELTQDQLNWGLNSGMPISASPKYVGEHMGLGYHPADIRRREKGNVQAYVEPASGVYLPTRQFTRSGYADFLPEDREWDVLHRMWPGTGMLLLGGDPALAAGYGRNTNVFGSLGVERHDPLSFKGRKGSGHPGGRCAYADKSLEPELDFQKFLYTYRVWGRLIYNPDTDPDVWLRFLRSKFGKAAKPLEIALANSSRVAHLITTAHGAATDNTIYKPEFYTNQPIVKESKESIFKDNPAPFVFGNVSPHDSQLFSKMNDYAASLLSGEMEAKYSPLQVAQWLDDMADTAYKNLGIAASLIADKNDVEYRRFYHDIKIQSGTAKFFADKMRAAVLWHVYLASDDTAALVEAIAHYTTARDAWAKMAEEAKPVYVQDITFGTGRVERGHWADRVPAMDADIADMKAELANANGKKSNNSEGVRKAINIVKTRPQLAKVDCHHIPVRNFKAGDSIKIDMKLTAEAKGVNLYYRHANQAIDWQVIKMGKQVDQYQAVIPAEYTKTRYPMTYYFAIDAGKDGSAIYPGLGENLNGMPYYVVRQNELFKKTARKVG
jgi:hypothetical protein